MRLNGSSNGSTRSSALWGKPSKGETRSSALWGKGGRGSIVALVFAVALAAPLAAVAGSSSRNQDKDIKAYLSPGLLDAIKANPEATYEVIVQARRGDTTAEVADEVTDAREDDPGRGVGLRKRFRSVAGVAAELTGKQILRLARRSHIGAITSDAPVTLSASSSRQRWPYVANLHPMWNTPATANAPAIAVVDSGIAAGRTDFGTRVVANVNLSTLSGNSAGDGRGHGTFVAGIAAGNGYRYAGASPGSKIVSIDVMDDQGMAMTRDVIAAADWILTNQDRYNIRVANFSLHSASPASVFFDPLDRAVERLWFDGVVVVTAAGNYGVDGHPSGVTFAPGNDPFVITVGAQDMRGTVTTRDDTAAPWSAFGYTLDGFSKPELGAPGRYIVGPVPTTSTLVSERPTNVRGTGYMELSGTSFAAPVVSGAAAQILARHPEWTPDQVKGALMLTARHTPYAAPGSLGVGVINATAAANIANPPNPNAALNRFVTHASDGSGPVFNAASWANTAMSDASWASASWANASWANASWANASWASASWANASWASASWASASWAQASWASASWANASWASASWANASWASVAYADNAEGEMSDTGEVIAEAELAELGIQLGE
jgi:serine protease AprX